MSLFKPKTQDDSAAPSDSLPTSSFTVPQEPVMQPAGSSRKRKLMPSLEPKPAESVVAQTRGVEPVMGAARPAVPAQPIEVPAVQTVDAPLQTPVPVGTRSKPETVIPVAVAVPPVPVREPEPVPANPEPVPASFEPEEILEVPVAVPENAPMSMQSESVQEEEEQASGPQPEPIIPTYSEPAPSVQPEMPKVQPEFERSVQPEEFSGSEGGGDSMPEEQALESQGLEEPVAIEQLQVREIPPQRTKPGLPGSLRNVFKKAKSEPVMAVNEQPVQMPPLRPVAKRRPVVNESQEPEMNESSQDYQPAVQQRPMRPQPMPARRMPVRPQQNHPVRRPVAPVEDFADEAEIPSEADELPYEQPQDTQPAYRPVRAVRPQRPTVRPHISISRDIETQEDIAPEEFEPARRAGGRYPETEPEADQDVSGYLETDMQESDPDEAEQEAPVRRMPQARARRPLEPYRQQRQPVEQVAPRRKTPPKSFGVKEKGSAPDGIFGTFFKQKSREEIEDQKRKLEKLEDEKNASKRLGDIEKTYKEGLTTLKDLLAPASLKFESSYFELNGKFGRSFFVLTYPRFLSSNWLSFIIQSEGALDVSMFIYPIDSETILKKLKSKVGEIGSQIAINQEKGMVRDPMLETAYNDVESLRDDLMQGTEKYFRFALYFTLYANDLQELDKNSATLESALGAKLIVTKRALMQTQDGFNSTLPLGLDDLDVANNMNTSPLSTVFPFVSSDLTGNDGILYGINRHNNSLILFDRFAMENANSVVFAKSGAGKSYAVKLEVLRSLMVGTDVIIIDPENEYKHLADAVGGTYLSVSLNAESRINPFDLPVGLEGEGGADILRSAVVNLLGLFNLMLGKLNPTEEALMDKAIWQTYAKKDITENSDFRMIECPTMNDLVEILQGMVGAESLAQRLAKYTEGTFAGLFNQPTNVVLNNQLVVFSIRDLEEELRPIAMYIVLNYIWNAIRSELKKRILAVDEAWILMQHEDSARFLFSIAKRGRKYYMGLTTITQDVADFMASPYGKPIVTNSSIQLLLKQSPAAINVIAETFFLTEGEKYLLLESEVGEGIFFAGLKHAAIKIYASYVEDQIITTDPKQLLEQEQQQEQ